MDSSDAIQLAVLIALLFVSSFFSSAETALTTVNKIRVRNLAEGGSKKAKILAKVVEDQSKMLSAILIGNNIANLTASSIATTLAISLFGSKWIGIATGILTLLILVLGEIAPKTLATVYSEKIALSYAKTIYFLMIILTPAIYIINKISGVVLMIMHIDPDKSHDVMTEDVLRTIVEVSHEDGVIESEEKKMINNVFDFGDSLAKDIMIPRIDMTMVDVNATYDELIDIFREEKYTRIPVFEETTDNVIGIINMKDLLLIDRNETFSIRSFLREPLYTYEFKKTAELMVEMRKTFNNIVIVLDEYGATAGLITLEDMLEEIVGEIRDEYDEDEEEDLIKINDKEYLVEGSMKLDDLNERTGIHLESEDYDSVGGFVIGILDDFPKEGEKIEYENIRFVVEHMEKNRIDKIHLYILDKIEEQQ